MLCVDFHGETFELHADRAAYWMRTRTLLIADPHFGKAASFRAAGVPVPRGTSDANVDRLTASLDRTGAQRLIILGDFLHDDQWNDDETMSSLIRWRERHADLEVLLVRGNHDRKAGDPTPELNIHCVDEPHRCGPFVLLHDPEAASGDVPALAGHVHPAVSLRDPLGHGMRCACFIFSDRLAILPAFGAFTGSAVRRPAAGDRIFITDREHIIELPTAPRAPGTAPRHPGTRRRSVRRR
jgi:DNA ligase-associated metallophosphoesterase